MTRWSDGVIREKHNFTVEIVDVILTSSNQRHPINIVALLLLPILCLVGLIGNTLVCIAIFTDKRLHNVTNYFLFSLALADLFVCLIVMPITIVVEVRHGVWPWNSTECIGYVYADVFLCSTSIVHMTFISLDRYLGISQPLRNRNKSKTAILTKIALVWFITLLISSPILFLALYDNGNILMEHRCLIFSRVYILYGSTLTFLIPFCVMLFTYLLTTNLLHNQAKTLSQRANERMNGNGLRRTMPHRKLGYVRTNSTSNALVGNNSNNNNHKTSSNSNYNKTSVVSYSMNYQTSPINSEIDVVVNKMLSNSNQEINGHKLLTKTSTINRWKNRTSNYLTSLASRVSRRNSIQTASQEIANEHKATRVLAVVFMCFFVCWTPFFAANILTGVWGSNIHIPDTLSSIFLWMGYISSTVNPIIYTVFNKRFRQAFVRILRCQCFHGNRDPPSLYSRNYTTVIPDTYTWSNHERAISVSGREGSMRRIGERWRRGNGEESKRSSYKKESPSPIDELETSPLVRGSRATTEETNASEEEYIYINLNQDKPKHHEHNCSKTSKFIMQRSLTTLLSPAATTTSGIISEYYDSNTLPKSVSNIECQRCAHGGLMIDSTDTETTISISSSITTACPKHITLFSSSFGKQIKETFL